METQIKKLLNNYCSELDDLLIKIDIDKNILISIISEPIGQLQDKEYLRSCIYEKILSFHNVFLDKCIQIIDDIYDSHYFEYASPGNLLYILQETKKRLFEFYNIYEYQISLEYFEKVLEFRYDDRDLKFIRTNIISNNYIKLYDQFNIKVDNKVMISYLYQLIKNHGNIDI